MLLQDSQGSSLILVTSFQNSMPYVHWERDSYGGYFLLSITSIE